MKKTASREENNTPIRSLRRQDTAAFYDGERQRLFESVIWMIAIGHDRERIRTGLLAMAWQIWNMASAMISSLHQLRYCSHGMGQPLNYKQSCHQPLPGPSSLLMKSAWIC